MEMVFLDERLSVVNHSVARVVEFVGSERIEDSNAYFTQPSFHDIDVMTNI